MAYTYEIGLGGINSRSGGAHEISIGFRFGEKEEGSGKHIKSKKSNFSGRSGRIYPQPTEFEYRRTK